MRHIVFGLCFLALVALFFLISAIFMARGLCNQQGGGESCTLWNALTAPDNN